MKLRSHLLIAALAVGLAGLTGCKSDSTGPDNNSNTDPIAAPKTGSTYTFNSYKTDSTGKKVTGSDETVTYTVISNNLTLGGKSNVVFVVSDRTEADSGYIHYESNGDVMIYQGSPEVGAASYSWIKLPFVSRSTENVTLIDSTFNDPDFSGHVKVTSQTTGTGTEKLTVGSEQLTANKATWKLDVTLPFFGVPITVTSTSTFSFVPKLGFWAKQETKQSGGLSGIGASSSGQVDILTSYTLK